MLSITADAAEAIRVALESPEFPESAGLRISTVPLSLNGGGPAIAVEMTPAPGEEDEILEEEGAQVFVAPEAAPVLQDKTLDADVQPTGEVKFSLLDQW